MKLKAARLQLLAAGIIALAAILMWAVGWLRRPLPVSLDDPAAAPIKDALAKSAQFEYTLFCTPGSDINMLDEVYVNLPDYPPNQNGRLLIAKYLGDAAASQPGYLSYRKAYHLWERSGDAYPSQSLVATPTQQPGVRPTPRPMRYCPDQPSTSDLVFRSIAIRDEKAIVTYDDGLYFDQATLVKLDGRWRIADVRVLDVRNP